MTLFAGRSYQSLSDACPRRVAGWRFRLLRADASRAVLPALLIAALLGGCEPTPVRGPAPSAPRKAAPQAEVGDSETWNAPSETQGAQNETWDAYFMQGVKIGYDHTVRRPHDAGDGRQLEEIDSHTVLKMTRGGQINSSEIRITSIETSDGRLVSFHSEASLGPTPLVVDGKVEGATLILEQRDNGKIARRQIPWPPETLGFSGPERLLRQKPMQPGERRECQGIMPLFNQVATITLVAVDYEETRLLTNDRKLLKIDCTTRIADGATLKGNIWATAEGEMIKTQMAGADQTSVRCTRAEALSTPVGKVDLFKDMVIRPKQRLHLPPNARQAQYIVHLRDGNPAERFPQGAYQSAETIDASTAKVTVWSAGPLNPPDRADLAPQAAPGPEFLAASDMLQINDPAVKAIADSVVVGARGSAERAAMLERAVFKAIVKKDYSQAFASAAETARSRVGDCTEHAMLLAAVARASGIPSRVAVGLIYADELGGFLFHMWTEVYVNDQWLPLDATLGRGKIGVTHLKLTDSSLTNETALSVLLPVMEVLGQLEIDMAGD